MDTWDNEMNGGNTENQENKVLFEATRRYVVHNFSKLHETAVSPPIFVGHFPWRIMVMSGRVQIFATRKKFKRFLGLFLQYYGESKSSTWVCNAIAQLRLISQKNGVENFFGEIQHSFYSEENECGFIEFMPMSEVLDPKRGFIKDDTIIVEVSIAAGVNLEDNIFVNRNFNEKTDYVGLKNQGATCYMNSLLQTLFFTNELRTAVYQIPIENYDFTGSVVFALQWVFYELQTSLDPVSTKILTKSFGWETTEASTQQDVQEFCRVLLDYMEIKMKGTFVEGTIPRLFEGKKTLFLRCKHVNYTSSRTESFYDVQLKVKGIKNIIESFKDYCTRETLDGENKYDAGEHGLQDAEKEIFFSSLPPVLHLHLLRFQFDPTTNQNIKINDRFEFTEKLNLEEFLRGEEDAPPPIYTLHAVLVHSGTNYSGHYVVFINPKGDGNWCQFNDAFVSPCFKEEAVDHNFGGHENGNAYMLVYIKDSAIEDVLGDVSDDLIQKFTEMKPQEDLLRKELEENPLYMKVQVVTSDDFCGHQGTDLYDPDKVHYKCFRVKKERTLGYFMQLLSVQMKYPIHMIRPWPVTRRKNETYRPDAIDLQTDYGKTIKEIANACNPWTIFLEILEPDSEVQCLPDFNMESDVLLFFKMYDPKNKLISYCGHKYMPKKTRVKELVPILNERACFFKDTELMLFGEVKPNVVEWIEDLEVPLEKVIVSLTNGDIIVFQKANVNETGCEFLTANEYFGDIFNRVEVTFCDITIPADAGFTAVLYLTMNYERMARVVAQKLNAHPYFLRFYEAQSEKGGPGAAFSYTFEGSLKDFLGVVAARQPKTIYYEQLSNHISEVEQKKQFKCTWVDSKLKEAKKISLYLSHKGCVADLLEEAKKHVQLSENGSGRLRLLEIVCFKVFAVQREDMPLDSLNNTDPKTLRIEEIPLEDLEMNSNEFLIPVAHFYEQPVVYFYEQICFTFGVPFLLKMKHQEPFSNVKERIQRKLELPDTEFERLKFAIIDKGRQQVIGEDYNYHIDMHDFFPRPDLSGALHDRPWLGLKYPRSKPANSDIDIRILK